MKPAHLHDGFWRSLWLPICVSVCVSLAVAPFTSLPGDVAVWLDVSQRAMSGNALYHLTGFSYPPLFGYWCMFLGGAAHALGLSASSLGGPDPKIIQTGPLAGPFVVTTPLYTLLVKLPMIAGDLVTGYFIWRIALRLSGDRAVARLAFLFFVLNPLVIVESAVHGQIDVLAACGIAAAIFFGIEDRWALAGVAITLGVAADLSPVFLVLPLLGYAISRGRWRSSGAFVAGGLITGVVVLGPVIAAGMIENVFTRVAVGASVGGLGLTGLTSLSFLNGVGAFLIAHSAGFGQFGDIVMVLTGLGVGVWLGQGRDEVALVRGCFLTIGVVLLVSAVVNPQYLLWITPFFALGAAGVISARPRQFVAGVVCLAVGGVGYLLALFGWAELLAPSSLAFGWPAAGTITSLWTTLAGTGGPWPLPPSLRSKLALFCALFVLGAGVLAVVGMRRGAREPLEHVTMSRSTREHPRRTVAAFGAVALGLGAVEVLGLITPSFGPDPSLTALITSQHKGRAEVSVTTRGDDRVSAFAVSDHQPIKRVIVYYSPDRPDSGAENSTVVGTEQALQTLLTSLPITTASAASLPHTLSTAPAGTLLVDVAGTLPNTIWGGGRSHILLSWIKAGGVLALAGDEPGLYAVGRGPMTVGPAKRLAPNVERLRPSALLPRGVIDGSTTWGAVPYGPRSMWATALGLRYSDDAVPLSIDQVLAHRGTVLGLLGRRHNTTEAYVPLGRGGVVDFAGYDIAGVVANDIAHLVLANFFSRVGTSVVTRMVSGHATLSVPLPSGARAIEVFATSTNPNVVFARAKRLTW